MDKKSQAIALFRYQLISPILNETECTQKAYLERITSREHKMPGREMPQSISAACIKKWLHRYRKLSFDGLVPKSRRDKGIFRTISEQDEVAIRNAMGTYKFRTARALMRYLIEHEVLKPDACSYATFVEYAKNKKLLTQGLSKEEYKSFEKSHINMLWVGDFLYGPHVRRDAKKERTYLFALLDDHSRFIIGAEFFYEQDFDAVVTVLRRALEIYGAPQKLYFDNGKVFVGNRIQLISAHLGIPIVHSKPYRPEGRGKIERFFRTVRDCFLDEYLANRMADGDPFSLADLNQALHYWLDAYQHGVHSSTKQAPHDRYMQGIKDVSIRRLSAQNILHAFFIEYERKVSSQALVSIDNIEYVVPGAYIGKTITIYKDEIGVNSPRFMIFENAQFVTIHVVDRHQNAEYPIKYPKNTSF